MRIEKIMCPHIALQNSGHRDHLFLAGREPRQWSLGPLLWHGAPVGSGAECPWITVKTRTRLLRPAGDCKLWRRIRDGREETEICGELCNNVIFFFFYHWPWEYFTNVSAIFVPLQLAGSHVTFALFLQVFWKVQSRGGKIYPHKSLCDAERANDFLHFQLSLAKFLSSIHLRNTKSCAAAARTPTVFMHFVEKTGRKEILLPADVTPCSPHISFYSQQCVRKKKKRPGAELLWGNLHRISSPAKVWPHHAWNDTNAAFVCIHWRWHTLEIW